MDLNSKKEALLHLGSFFQNAVLNQRGEQIVNEQPALEALHIELDQLINRVQHENGWFTKDSVMMSFSAWANSLTEEKINQWLGKYSFSAPQETQKIGVIMAGNIPLVGLHDALCVLLSGDQLYAKVSSKDKSLMSFILNTIGLINENWKNSIHIVEQLKGIDTLIATGSDNSARYFEYYFKDKKRLIRRNRTSVAILDGNESEEELHGLSDDVFTHYGLGCRNVTKVYVPQGYDLDSLFKAFFHYKEIGNHNKYGNNYDYNKAVYLLNNISLVENGFLLMKEDKGLHSPVGVLFYEFYNTIEKVQKELEGQEESIQCIVSNSTSFNQTVPFGKAQSPELWDYADNIDTLQFLMEN